MTGPHTRDLDYVGGTERGSNGIGLPVGGTVILLTSPLHPY